MKDLRLKKRGITLVELMVSVSVLFLFMGLVAWLVKGSADMRIKSERRLNLLTQLQRNMFRIESDFLSARRHTLGNVLCNNIVVSIPGFGDYRTTSDPGFDFSWTPFTNDPGVRTAWFWQRNALIPMGIGNTTGDADVRVEQGPAARFHGTGSLSIRSSLAEGAYFSVRSPDVDGLIEQDYVLAGWVRGDDAGGGSFLTPQLVFQRDTGDGLPLNDIVSVTAPAVSLTTWTYISVIIPSAEIVSTWNYNIYLRTVRRGANGRTFSALFDDVTVTPVNQIAAINFESSRLNIPSNPNVNLHNRNDVGTVFYVTNPSGSSDLQEMKYIFSEDDLGVFPAIKPDLLRFRGEIPFLSALGLRWTAIPPLPAPPEPFPFLKQDPLLNISELKVSWVGSGTLGANRRILVSLTVRDQKNPPNTLKLERTLFPPTD
jgi:type II secretory pathway pseudopilin PulG